MKDAFSKTIYGRFVTQLIRVKEEQIQKRTVQKQKVRGPKWILLESGGPWPPWLPGSAATDATLTVP